MHAYIYMYIHIILYHAIQCTYIYVYTRTYTRIISITIHPPSYLAHIHMHHVTQFTFKIRPSFLKKTFSGRSEAFRKLYSNTSRVFI